jgi:NAD(P)-dependent dehydrogenase (short-subunit alcohol dehydrogenase family)
MKKFVVVTGGSSGIGLAIVQRFLEDGHQVFNLDVKASEIGEFVKCDMRNHQAVQSCIAAIGQQHTIDVLVCNAGMHMSANIEETSEAAFLDLFNLNVKGAFSVTQSTLPHMKEKGGSVIFVASDQAQIAKRNSFAYNLSKHALASMAKTTALDYAQYNIRSTAVCPGTIETPLYHNAIDSYVEKSGADEAQTHSEEAALQPLGRIGQASEVASFVYYLASEEASFITGSLHMIDGGYCAQ